MTHHVICPGCATVFRVTPSQMSMRDGQLRCGRCQTVFNGWHHLEGPVSEPGQDEASPEIVQNQFIRSTRNNDEQGERLQRDSPSSGDPLPEILRPRQPLGYLRGFWLLIVFIALAALVIQGALFWREQLVARFPVIRPVLANLCTLDGVRLELPHVASLISLDSSELRTDAEPGIYTLDASVVNHASFTQQYPLMQLSLTDVHNTVIARRVFSPAVYLGPKGQPEKGIPPHSEVDIQLPLKVSGPDANGYHVYIFYPLRP